MRQIILLLTCIALIISQFCAIGAAPGPKTQSSPTIDGSGQHERSTILLGHKKVLAGLEKPSGLFADLYREALTQYGKGNVNKGLDLLKRGLDANPHFYRGYLEMARWYVDTGNTFAARFILGQYFDVDISGEGHLSRHGLDPKLVAEEQGSYRYNVFKISKLDPAGEDAHGFISDQALTESANELIRDISEKEKLALETLFLMDRRVGAKYRTANQPLALNPKRGFNFNLSSPSTTDIDELICHKGMESLNKLIDSVKHSVYLREVRYLCYLLSTEGTQKKYHHMSTIVMDFNYAAQARSLATTSGLEPSDLIFLSDLLVYNGDLQTSKNVLSNALRESPDDKKAAAQFKFIRELAKQLADVAKKTAAKEYDAAKDQAEQIRLDLLERENTRVDMRRELLPKFINSRLYANVLRLFCQIAKTEAFDTPVPPKGSSSAASSMNKFSQLCVRANAKYVNLTGIANIDSLLNLSEIYERFANDALALHAYSQILKIDATHHIAKSKSNMLKNKIEQEKLHSDQHQYHRQEFRFNGNGNGSGSGGPHRAPARKQGDFKGFYKSLGVNKNATKKEINKAYRKLAAQYHPDKSKEEDKTASTEKFMQITEAKEILADDEKRKLYDSGIDPTLPEGQQQQQHHQFDPRMFTQFGGARFTHGGQRHSRTYTHF